MQSSKKILIKNSRKQVTASAREKNTIERLLIYGNGSYLEEPDLKVVINDSTTVQTVTLPLTNGSTTAIIFVLQIYLV